VAVDSQGCPPSVMPSDNPQAAASPGNPAADATDLLHATALALEGAPPAPASNSFGDHGSASSSHRVLAASRAPPVTPRAADLAVDAGQSPVFGGDEAPEKAFRVDSPGQRAKPSRLPSQATLSRGNSQPFDALGSSSPLEPRPLVFLPEPYQHPLLPSLIPPLHTEKSPVFSSSVTPRTPRVQSQLLASPRAKGKTHGGGWGARRSRVPAAARSGAPALQHPSLALEVTSSKPPPPQPSRQRRNNRIPSLVPVVPRQEANVPPSQMTRAVASGQMRKEWEGDLARAYKRRGRNRWDSISALEDVLLQKLPPAWVASTNGTCNGYKLDNRIVLEDCKSIHKMQGQEDWKNIQFTVQRIPKMATMKALNRNTKALMLSAAVAATKAKDAAAAAAASP